MTLRLLLNQAGASPSVLDRRCVADIAKCLMLTAVVGRDENMVNEVLTEHGPDPEGRVRAKWEPVFRTDHVQTLKQRSFDAVALAAGADDQGCGIEQRKALRGHEDPVVGRSIPRKIDHGIGARG